jgi:cold shock CspA family protein
MKDQILDAYLRDFIEKFGLGTLKEDQAFERLVSYCVVAKHYADTFDPDEVCVGGSGDLGLDAVAILVNDHLVFSKEDVDHLKKTLRRLDVQFVFVQAKSAAKFEAAEIGTFISGVRHFFERKLPSETNVQVRDLHVIKEHIFASSIHMDRSPSCHLYYASTGAWLGEKPLVSRIDQGVSDLKKTSLFSSVGFTPIDLEWLKKTHRELNHKIVREIIFEKHTFLPQIGGVLAAYIGVVPCLEYLKLLTNEDGTLNRRLFYDNVRDFQGNNPVNREIEATIRDSSRKDRFALLNNGVTVVARDINPVGPAFRLVDYQIVNGCQTSHILFNNRDQLSPHAYLPLKLIVTTDGDVTNQVIQGTNRQTEVKVEAFESLSPFQKKLEEYFLAVGRGQKEPLYYERRSKQYEHLGVRRDRLVSLATQAKCFLAMFLNEPHSTHRYYGELLSSYQNKLFSEAHSPAPYYVSSAALAKLETLFATGRLARNLRHLKYQILMVFRLQNEAADLPPLNSKAIQSYCDALLSAIQGPRSDTLFQTAADTVAGVRKKLQTHEQPERTRSFTAALIDAAATRGGAPAASQRIDGTVKVFSDVKGWGFITTDDGEDVFVHYTGIVGPGFRYLMAGERVRFAIAAGPKGPVATEVEVVGAAKA